MTNYNKSFNEKVSREKIKRRGKRISLADLSFAPLAWDAARARSRRRRDATTKTNRKSILIESNFPYIYVDYFFFDLFFFLSRECLTKSFRRGSLWLYLFGKYETTNLMKYFLISPLIHWVCIMKCKNLKCFERFILKDDWNSFILNYLSCIKLLHF